MARKSMSTASRRLAVFTAAAGYAARFGRAVERLSKDRRGVSAVEFAFLLPVMMTVFLGTVETTQGIAANRKVTLTAHTIADLATQYTNITNADMSNVLAAGTAIIVPFSATNLTEVVSELSINAQGQASVVWSDTLNGTARSVGQTVSIPSSLAVPNTYLVLSEVTYNYNPTYGYVITGTLTLSGHIYMRPRQSASISRSAS